MTATKHPLDVSLIARVLGEYQEMPGLALTLDQARRLWGCDEATCRAVVDHLLSLGALRWSRDGRLVRGTSQPCEARS